MSGTLFNPEVVSTEARKQIKRIDTKVVERHNSVFGSLDLKRRYELEDALKTFRSVSAVVKADGDIKALDDAAETYMNTADSLIDKAGVEDPALTANSAEAEVHQEPEAAAKPAPGPPNEHQTEMVDLIARQKDLEPKAGTVLLAELDEVKAPAVEAVENGSGNAPGLVSTYAKAVARVESIVADLESPNRNERRQLLNQACPCGSGSKFKNCHGKDVEHVHLVDPDVPFREHPDERPPTDEELDEDEPAPDPIFITDTGGIIMAHGRNTILYSRPGGGKTWIALDTAIDAARRGGRVVYYNWDQSSKKGTKRLWRKLKGRPGWSPELRDSITVVPAKRFDSEELAARRLLANDWLLDADNPERSIVIIDTISNAGGAINKPERYKAWAKVHIEPHSLAGIATFGLAHEAKTSPKGPFGSVLSLADCDKAIRAACVGSQKMPNKKHSGQFTFFNDKDREADSDAQEGEPLALVDCKPSPGGPIFTFLNPDPKAMQALLVDAEHRNLKAEIIDLLKARDNHEWVGKVKLRAKLGCDRDLLDAALSELEAEGRIKIDKVGKADRYTLLK